MKRVCPHLRGANIIMYKCIETKLALSGMSKKQLAKELGIGYNTLRQKLSGSSPVTLEEAFRLKEILNAQESIEVLFEPATDCR